MLSPNGGGSGGGVYIVCNSACVIALTAGQALSFRMLVTATQSLNGGVNYNFASIEYMGA